MTEKRCNKCGEMKPVAEFSHNTRALGGLDYWCKECKKEANREYYQNHSETLKAVSRKRYQNHPEARKAACQRYYKEHLEAYKATHRRYRKEHLEARKAAAQKYYKEHREVLQAKQQKRRKEHPEIRKTASRKYYAEHRKEHKAQQQEWNKKHPELLRKYEATRRAREKQAFIEDVDPKVVYERDEGRCYLCSKEITFKEMHLEHVIPLAAGVEAGGVHSYANCKCACAHCNLSKGAKILVA